MTNGRRNRAIARRFAAGEERAAIAADFKISQGHVSRIALQKGAKARWARKTKGAHSERVWAFIQPDLKAEAVAAAAARGLSVGQLVSKIANTALSEPGLLDNVLDDKGTG